MLIREMNKNHKSNIPILHGKTGGYWFEFPNGELSKVFYNARRFSAGFAPVQEFGNSEWRFLNVRNSLSRDSYASVNCYDDHNGFAKVVIIDPKTKREDTFHRDSLGRLSNGLTDSGQAYFLYLNNMLDWKNMDMRYFDDIIFRQGIIKEEMRRFISANPKASREEKQEYLALIENKIDELCAEERASNANKNLNLQD